MSTLKHKTRKTKARNVPLDYEQIAAQSVAKSLIEAHGLVPVDSLPGVVYNFDPTGRQLFALLSRRPMVGATEYIAVNKSTGEVRRLGLVGE